MGIIEIFIGWIIGDPGIPIDIEFDVKISRAVPALAENADFVDSLGEHNEL